MKLRRVLGVALPALLLIGACGDEDTSASTEGPAGDPVAEVDPADSGSEETSRTVTIEHYSGTDDVPVNPETVVVMDTGVLLSLHSLGVEVDGFGSLGAVPAEYEAVVNDPNLEPVGTAFEPDYEAINALEPDLIIVASRSSATYPDMSEIAPTVDLTLDENADYLSTFRERHEALGQIFGVEDEVDEQLTTIEASIDELATQTAEAGSALIVMTNGAEVSAYGPGSRFGLVHDLMGYAAADESLSEEATHGEAVSFEFLLDAAPDVLFVIDRSSAIGEEAEAAHQVLDNELVNQTPAWQNDRVVYTDAFAWYIVSHSIPGMETIVSEVEGSLP